MRKNDPSKLKKVSLNLPFGIGGTEWEPDPTERKAAWSLYVELVTRIAIQGLDAEYDQRLLPARSTFIFAAIASPYLNMKKLRKSILRSFDVV